MLNNTMFVEESIDLNLFALRTIRQYCVNMELSFYENKGTPYRERAKKIRSRTGSLFKKYLEYTKGKVPQNAIDYQLFVTEYTLASERLTEELSGLSLDTEITEEELNLQAGNREEPTKEVLDQVAEANKESLSIMEDFIVLVEDVYRLLKNNQLFSYTYPAFYNYMITQMRLLKENLQRIQKKRPADPTFITNEEFNFNSTMYDVCLFVRGFVDPDETQILNELNYFILSYPALLRDYQTLPLTPDNQKLLTVRSLAITERLRGLFKTMLSLLLDAKLYFITEATTIDNFYTDINYTYFILKENSRYQGTI